MRRSSGQRIRLRTLTEITPENKAKKNAEHTPEQTTDSVFEWSLHWQ